MFKSIRRRVRRKLGLDKKARAIAADEATPAQSIQPVLNPPPPPPPPPAPANSYPPLDFYVDGTGVIGKNLGFLQDPRFKAAWAKATELNVEGWRGGVPDIRWRAHVACWAASHAMTLKGDFVECGVHTGLLSLTVCHYLDFNKTGRKFWLFDTFEGVPLNSIDEREIEHVKYLNKVLYFDVYQYALRNFSTFPTATLVRGFLPDTLEGVDIEAISYMSIDLNNSAGEKAAIEKLWPKVVNGGIIVLDDYAFANYVPQYEMWNEYARSVGRTILTLPTGQGLLIK